MMMSAATVLGSSVATENYPPELGTFRGVFGGWLDSKLVNTLWSILHREERTKHFYPIFIFCAASQQMVPGGQRCFIEARAGSTLLAFSIDNSVNC